jgi:dTDP-4-dehydrorhamnose 3,5-epimerase
VNSPRFEFQGTPLPGLQLVRRKPIGDARGQFARFFSAEIFLDAGFGPAISQINHSRTARIGAVRGLHFQHPPHAEAKVVTCFKGRVFDVAVDLRQGSPTFLQWQGFLLSAEEPTSLLIPEGFAHGFQTLEPDCELLYLHSAPYRPEAEGGLDAIDPALAIAWPLEITERSERDQAHPRLRPDFEGLRL